jgi:hypothetical protein
MITNLFIIIIFFLIFVVLFLVLFLTLLVFYVVFLFSSSSPCLRWHIRYWRLLLIVIFYIIFSGYSDYEVLLPDSYRCLYLIVFVFAETKLLMVIIGIMSRFIILLM